MTQLFITCVCTCLFVCMQPLGPLLELTVKLQLHPRKQICTRNHAIARVGLASTNMGVPQCDDVCQGRCPVWRTADNPPGII